jgi:hypothetical protein
VNEDELSEAQQAARDELADLLQRHAALLGPWDETGETPVPDTVFLEDWVFVASWTDSQGGTWLTRIPSKDLPQYRRDGLLHQGLYAFAD